MVDRDKIEGMIRHVRRYTTYLREVVDQDQQKFLEDPRSIGSARYYIQVSVETCINIANHIISTEGMRAPKDYKDTFRVLDEAGVLPEDSTHAMGQLAGPRNLLVHVYWDVDDVMIYEGIRSELDDFDTFVKHVMDYLERTTSGA